MHGWHLVHRDDGLWRRNAPEGLFWGWVPWPLMNPSMVAERTFCWMWDGSPPKNWWRSKVEFSRQVSEENYDEEWTMRRRTYQTRQAARQDVFEHIKLFYNPKRKHTKNGMLSPVDFKIRQQKMKQAGV
jgi:putative transposase